MEFHISRNVRDRYGISDLLFNYAGNVVFGNIAASRELAKRVNEVRGAGKTLAPAEVMHAGSLFAMGLIDELNHALIAQFRETLDPEVLSAALQWFQSQANEIGVEKLLTTFTQQFPNVGIYRGEQTVQEWLDGSTEGMSNREAAVEELLMLWLANINPAFAPFKEFFDDTDLEKKTVYKAVTSTLDEYFATRPVFDLEVGTLLDALLAPMLASPDSLTGQLAFIREKWVEYLGDELRQVLLAIDTLKEEDIAIWMQFHPASGMASHRQGQQGWGSEGFIGDEFVGFEGAAEERARRWREAQSQEQPVVNEYEAFSPDQAWMPTVVLLAKSTYVWLEQLSKKFQRHIQRLDQIPDEELALIADRGLNGLWLIGLWERSSASQTIKRLRGQADAVASAYSVADYRIAEDLGGEPAYRHLRDRCAVVGIRLASDMVPNHMGIDSTWVMEHPEWFLSRAESPFPVYSFEGPDLSNDSRVEIKIEDHYFDQTDAAVVFRRRDRMSGHTDFMYHGNDGTTFAWNDTAQLDYSKAVVREQVMQTILQVARLFPIIRFDAAMTLAKKHVQRLWFPIPGVGGSIPSRAEDSMTNAEFDALMPNEFWREVVDRVAVEVPGTLLLAEAFWLLEGYFVRTLGMHRVYNSAFMNMLRDEENAKYRSYLKKTIEFDPDILKRYVNFMSNPDERTAIDQFGSGDRYFGVCTLLATLPGLPMFGHGQIEAFTEKYGMEYKKARFDESPNEDLVARHQREIAPLLKNRQLFAGSSDFFLYDFWNEDGSVDESVYAYSNLSGAERAIIFFNNRYGGTRGTIHTSAESMDKGSGTLRSRRLDDALQLGAEDSLVVAYKDVATGLEYLRRSNDLAHHGITIELRAYQYVVLQHWRQLRSTAEQPWDRLCDALNGAGVYNLDEALSKLRLRPLHEALRQMLCAGSIEAVIEVSASSPQKKTPQAEPVAETIADKVAHVIDTALSSLLGSEQAEAPLPKLVEVKLHETRLVPLFDKAKPFFESVEHLEGRSDEAEGTRFQKAIEDSVKAVTRLPEKAASYAATWPGVSGAFLPIGSLKESLGTWAPILAWSVLSALKVKSRENVVLFDQLQLRAALAETFSSLGLEGEGAWRAAARVRILLAYGTSPSLEDLLGSGEFWSDPDVRWLTGAGEYQGKTYFNKEQFEEMVGWLLIPVLLAAKEKSARPKIAKNSFLTSIAATAEKSGFEVQKLVAQLQPIVATAPLTPPVVEVSKVKASVAKASAKVAKKRAAPKKKVT
ncbi:alpha-amylase family protein [Granulicella arctica]|uniref:alpha-amylase family glycosyl hydrolase n=1 Tax=Granulicella arctica TaxID=940613 RepID=UPI0021E05DC0|nr:alpha-amylase family glycosyl hydrolase [Granulicella arctica]